jgi:hypothetical protein
MSKVNVYSNDEVIARVKYNNNLDWWNGQNWTCGSIGRHKGITKLKNGQYVLIHGSDWQGEDSYGEIISPERAIQEILKSGDEDLLDTYGLRELASKNLIEEE